MSSAGVENDSPNLLFHQRAFHKHESVYSLGKGALSFSRNREILKEALVALSLDAQEHGAHSLRSGNLTSVVRSLQRQHHSGQGRRKIDN